MKPIDTFEKAWTLYQLDIPLHWGDWERLAEIGPTGYPFGYTYDTVKMDYDEFGLAVEVEETEDEQQ